VRVFAVEVYARFFCEMCLVVRHHACVVCVQDECALVSHGVCQFEDGVYGTFHALHVFEMCFIDACYDTNVGWDELCHFRDVSLRVFAEFYHEYVCFFVYLALYEARDADGSVYVFRCFYDRVLFLEERAHHLFHGGFSITACDADYGEVGEGGDFIFGTAYDDVFYYSVERGERGEYGDEKDGEDECEYIQGDEGDDGHRYQCLPEHKAEYEGDDDGEEARVAAYGDKFLGPGDCLTFRLSRAAYRVYGRAKKPPDIVVLELEDEDVVGYVRNWIHRGELRAIRNDAISCATFSGWSRKVKWPVFLRMVRVAFGISRFMVCASSTGVCVSSSPQMRCVGCWIFDKSGVRSSSMMF